MRPVEQLHGMQNGNAASLADLTRSLAIITDAQRRAEIDAQRTALIDRIGQQLAAEAAAVTVPTLTVEPATSTTLARELALV